MVRALLDRLPAVRRRAVVALMAQTVVSLAGCGSGVLYAPWQTADGGGWTQEGGDAEGHRRRADGVEPPLRLRWQQDSGKPPLSAPLLAGPLLLQWSKDATLSAFDVATGTRLGRRVFDDPVCGAPALAGDGARLMLATVLERKKTQLRAVDLATGDVAWRIEGAACAALVVRRDTAYAALESGRLHAIDVGSGRVLWTRTLAAPLLAAPSLTGGRLVLPDGDGEVVAISADSGAVLWRRSLDRPIRLQPAMDPDGQRLFVAGDGILHSLDLATGEGLWHAAFDGLPGGVHVAGPQVVVSSSDHGLHAFATADGEALWRADLGGIVRGAPVGTGATIYIGAGDGTLYGIDAADGTTRWRQEIDGPVRTSVALSPTLLAVTSERGTTHVFARR